MGLGHQILAWTIGLGVGLFYAAAVAFAISFAWVRGRFAALQSLQKEE